VSDLDIVEVDDHVARLCLNRPLKRNAMSAAMIAQLTEVLGGELTRYRAVVVEGEGPTFCAGVDLAEIRRSEHRSDPEAASRLFAALRNAAPVLIAAVTGHALGLGSGIAMACDVVIAADDAVFGYPEIRHDLVAGVTLVGLRELVGLRRATDYLLTGRAIGAAEALAVGMVTELRSAAEVRPRALAMATEIASRAPGAVAMTRRLLREAGDLTHAEAVVSGERAVHEARSARQAAATTAATTAGVR
jgi:enoyl-CoA hydratase/carnithine racemase